MARPAHGGRRPLPAGAGRPPRARLPVVEIPRHLVRLRRGKPGPDGPATDPERRVSPVHHRRGLRRVPGRPDRHLLHARHGLAVSGAQAHRPPLLRPVLRRSLPAGQDPLRSTDRPGRGLPGNPDGPLVSGDSGHPGARAPRRGPGHLRLCRLAGGPGNAIVRVATTLFSVGRPGRIRLVYLLCLRPGPLSRGSVHSHPRDSGGPGPRRDDPPPLDDPPAGASGVAAGFPPLLGLRRHALQAALPFRASLTSSPFWAAFGIF